MKYNTVHIEISLPLSEDGYVFDVGSLYDALLKLTDKRKARGKRYELALVLVVIVLAKLSGEDTPYGIADWGRQHAVELCALLAVKRAGLPAHNTYRRVLCRVVDVAELQQVISQVLSQLPGVGWSVLIALDGKTLRGSLPVGQTKGIHLLAAYLPAEGIVLMQVAVDCKENEISAAPRVLHSLDLRGKIVRGDALHTQRALSVQIVTGGGEYVWIVKDNQPQLLADIQQSFAPQVCTPGFSPTPTDFQTAQTTDTGHGRVETRTLTTTSILKGYSDWPYLEQAFKLERRVLYPATGLLHEETVYGIASLTPAEAGPKRLLELVRDYWGIENGLHYRRDTTLKEDATRMTHATQAEAMAILNNLIIGLTLTHGWTNLAAARRHYNAHLGEALKLVLHCQT